MQWGITARDVTNPMFLAFWIKVDQSAGIDGCWTRGVRHDSAGYSQFTFDGLTDRAHRVAFISVWGDLPSNRPLVCHICPEGGHRWCVNPVHLVSGTNQTNHDDRTVDGRTAWGELVGTSKLKIPQVLEIKEYISMGYTDALLSRQYGVYESTIRRIRIGETWAHLH